MTVTKEQLQNARLDSGFKGTHVRGTRIKQINGFPYIIVSVCYILYGKLDRRVTHPYMQACRCDRVSSIHRSSTTADGTVIKRSGSRVATPNYAIVCPEIRELKHFAKPKKCSHDFVAHRSISDPIKERYHSACIVCLVCMRPCLQYQNLLIFFLRRTTQDHVLENQSFA